MKMWIPRLNNGKLPAVALAEGALLFWEVGPYQVILSVPAGVTDPGYRWSSRGEDKAEKESGD
jgi:hypothetical protein